MELVAVEQAQLAVMQVHLLESVALVYLHFLLMV
jgi:hypothetical protein